ncbi:hypothetical protein [Pseudomonas sp. PLMAX]|uniref:hypothetical protein n=1 Tax=Pseudomonas sp. PLMAX TaxID=2201998 RepID=UPI0038B850E3
MPDLLQPFNGERIVHVTVEQLNSDLLRRLQGNQIIYLWPSGVPAGTEGTPTKQRDVGA